MERPHEELARLIAFSGYRNINAGTATRMGSLGVTPEAFFSLEPRALAAMTGLKPDYFSDSRRKEALDAGRREAEFVIRGNVRAIYHTDSGYPRRLAECSDAPAMLFTAGNSTTDYAHAVAIVGTRHATSYGAEFTRRLVEELADALDSIVIISGLAYGIDIAAHKAAISAGIPTGAVLAHGLNTIYPADHRDHARRIVADGGFIATEYRSIDSIHRGNFLARNRIVAGMADVTVVVESDLRGGAMATARIASAYNREVMAAPGRAFDPYSRGCNALIASHTASLIRDAADLIEATGWTPKPREGEQQSLDFELGEEQRGIIDFINANPGATVNDICTGIGIPYSRLSGILFEMEMDDILISLPGGRYGVTAKTR